MIRSKLATDYLARLDAAIADLPHGIAVELRNGIAEEFEGLNDHAAAGRIARLGTPEQVASEARAAATPAPATEMTAGKLPLRDTRSFAVLSLVIFGLGSFLVPVVGTIIGAVLVSMSTLWSTREKLWALLSPLFGTVAAWIVGAIISTWAGNTDGNPLVPAFYEGIYSVVLLGGFIIAPIAAVWLLVRILRK